MPTLVLFGGYPGVGKTTLSYRLASDRGWTLLTKDVIFSALSRSEVSEDRIGFASYETLLALIKLNLTRGVSVVCEGGFQFSRLRHIAFSIGEDAGATCYGIECICSDVALWRQRLTNRPQLVEGFAAGGWEDAERISKVYEPWDTSRLVLDAVEPIEHLYTRLLRYIGL